MFLPACNIQIFLRDLFKLRIKNGGYFRYYIKIYDQVTSPE